MHKHTVDYRPVLLFLET